MEPRPESPECMVNFLISELSLNIPHCRKEKRFGSTDFKH